MKNDQQAVGRVKRTWVAEEADRRGGQLESEDACNMLK